jgi:hypothetical protein
MSQFICQQAELWGAVGALQAEVERKEAKLVSLRLSSAERLATVEEEKMTVAMKLAEAQRQAENSSTRALEATQEQNASLRYQLGVAVVKRR